MLVFYYGTDAFISDDKIFLIVLVRIYTFGLIFTEFSFVGSDQEIILSNATWLFNSLDSYHLNTINNNGIELLIRNSTYKLLIISHISRMFARFKHNVTFIFVFYVSFFLFCHDAC